MDALFGMADRVTVLAQGRILTEGTPAEVQNIGRGAGRLSRGRPRMSYLEIDKINSFYGDSHILFDVSMRLEQKEVVALLGRNGAGKSTTLKSLMGAVDTKSGSIKLDGRELRGARQHTIANAGHAAGAGGAADLRQPQCRGEHRSGRTDREAGLAARARLRDVPAIEGAAHAAAAPICRAASSRCWRSRGR